MTKQRASELWPVLQAWTASVPIQVSIHGERWETYTGTCPDFNNINCKWRLAPEPKDYWLAGEKVYLFPTCKQGDQVTFAGNPIHVREVLP